MSDKTGIEWTDATWNPVDGCTPVSEGCKNCYAAGMARRFWGDRKFSDVQCHEDRLDIPLKWKKPQRIFVNSMSDLFHDDVPFEFIAKIFTTMSYCPPQKLSFAPRHTFKILTKRPRRMAEFFEWVEKECAAEVGNDEGLRILPNVHIGVSVENQEQANKRIPELVKIPAAARFVSVEPMLSATNLDRHLFVCSSCTTARDSEECMSCPEKGATAGIDGVICGCESGPGARETKIEWVRDLRDECKEAGVPFFLKQLKQNGKLVKMPLLDGVRHDALPEGK